MTSFPPTKKYLTTAEFIQIVGVINITSDFTPMSQDTYNETAVAKAIADTGKIDQLCMAAINMACVGYGNRRYGTFKYKESLVEVQKLLLDAGVKLALNKDAKLKENDLTAQRLCRAFRSQIRDYLVKTKFETYIYRKYSDHVPKYAHLLFRGSEYLDDLTQDEVTYILDTYKNMDTKTNFELSPKITRVFQAKGYMKRIVSDSE
jgi:hypothetical protein